MCKSCGCKDSGKPIKYKCNCTEEDCKCRTIEFDEDPKSTPYCCGVPMEKLR